jgi:hypothetical protein
MIRADGPAREHHLRFVRRPAAFDVIAPKARAHQIFPGILTAAAFRHDVIDGERNARSTAILAPMAIAPQDILSRKNYLLKRHPNIRRKANHAREWHGNRSRAHRTARHGGHEFRFFKIEQNNRFLDIRNGKRLVIAIQDQNLAAELRVRRTKLAVVVEEIGRSAQRRRIR